MSARRWRPALAIALLLTAGSLVAGAAVNPSAVSFQYNGYDWDSDLDVISGEMAHVGSWTGLPPGGVVFFGSVAPAATVLEFQITFDQGSGCFGEMGFSIEGALDGLGTIGTPPAGSWTVLPPGPILPDAYHVLVENGDPVDCNSSPISFSFFAAMEPPGRFKSPDGVSWICHSAPGDDDCDGVPNVSDICPSDYDPDQLDSDSDGLGDACNQGVDSDRDGWADSLDNCPLAPNTGQEDGDSDGEGDACEPGSSAGAPIFRTLSGSPLGISPDGDFVVGSIGVGYELVYRFYSGGYALYDLVPKKKAFRWERGVSSVLEGSSGNGLSHDASVGGGVVVGATRPHAGAWDNVGYFSGLRWAGGPYELLSSGASNEARGVSRDGSVIVHGQERREGAVITDLGGLPGATVTESHDVSADGSVVVGSCYISAQFVHRAFRWEGGSMLELGDLPGGGDESVALAVSGDGEVVVGHASAAAGKRAFRWRSGVMVDLGVLPGKTSSEAMAVSGDGSVIVGRSGNAAFIWDSVNGMRDLRAVLENDLGVTVPSGLNSANGISDDGTTIVGTATSNASWIVHHASLAPASSPVPGLGAWGIGVALAGLLGVGVRRLAR